MFDKFDFFKIQQEDVDKKMSNLLLTTTLSVVGMVGLVLISALFVGDDEDDESEQDDSDE